MRKKKMKMMYEEIIADYERCCQGYKATCENYSAIMRDMTYRDKMQKRLIGLGELCGRWINVQNPKISATLFLDGDTLHVMIYRGKSLQTATTVIRDEEGLCMTYSVTAFMLPVKQCKEIGGLLLGEYGLFLRENDTMFTGGQEE